MLIIAATIVVVIGMLALATRLILFRSFLDLEQQDAATNIERMEQVLQHQMEAVTTTAGDWAHWDATYDFVEDRNEGYITENLSDESFATLGNHLLLLLDTQNDLIYGKYYDESGDRFVNEVPPGMREAYLQEGMPLVTHDSSSGSVTGLVIIGEQPMIVSAYPILDSHNQGPVRGTLIWGRYLDDHAKADLAAMTDLPIEVFTVDSDDLPEDAQESITLMRTGHIAEYTFEESPTRLAIYAMAYDVNGDPAIALRAVMERSIAAQGRIALLYVLVAVALAGLVIGLVSTGELQRAVLSRLGRLNRSVQSVTNPSARIKVEGQDELGQLATSINSMLRAMEQSDQALRESEDRYRRLIEFSPEALAVHVDGRIVYANQAAAQLFGAKEPVDLLGRHMLEFVHPDYHAMVVERIRRTLELQEEQPLVAQQYIRMDKTVIDVEVVAIPITYYGRPASQIMARDITERKRAETALRDAHEQLEATLDALPDLMFVVDAEGRIYDYRAARDSMLFAPPENFLAKTVRDVLPETPAALIMGAIEQALIEGHVSGVEYHLQTPEGWRWYELSVAVRGSKDREDVRLVTLARDVTERKMAQEAEREQRALFEALGATAAALSSTLDLDEVYSRILESISSVVPHDAANIMVVEDGEARIVRWHKHTQDAPDDLDQIRFTVNEVGSLRFMAAHRKPLIIQDVEQFAEWRDVGATRWIRSFASAPILIDDEVVGFINLDSSTVGFYNEGHAERLRALSAQAALALRNARLYREIVDHADALAERNRELDAFSYTVAHDLKSPLQVIIGYADLLRTDYHSEMSVDVLNHIITVETFAYKMSHMIESLLMLSTLRSAEQAIRRVDMQPVVEAAAMRLSHKLKARGMRIELPETYPPVMGFGPWLEEIFANFIENAIKYMSDDNPAPYVRIAAVPMGDKVRYEVRDNGVGIKPEDQPKLWEMFTRFHLGKTQGSGLGLSIVRRIITKLNGEVGAESAPGQGSTFWFALPAVGAETEVASQPEAAAQPSTEIISDSS